MSIDMPNILNNMTQKNQRSHMQRAERKIYNNVSQQKQSKPEPPLTQEELKKIVKELQSVSGIFNKHLKYTINSELGEVVVKVIDNETDKVIKEIPPETLQRLHIRIKETIGILFDESI